MAGKHKTIPVFVPHWGCPQDCLFCNQKAITGLREDMTTEKAEKIIARGIKNRKPGERVEIGFFGGSFTGIPAPVQEALLGLAQRAVAAGQAEGIRLSTRPDYVNDAVLERLLRFGVTCVELGAQSMNDEVLSLSKRGHSAAQTVLAAEKIRAAGLSLGLQMMTGLPGDTAEKTMETAKAFISLKPQCVRIYPTLVLQNTALATLYEAGGYEPLTVEEAVCRCAKLYRSFTEAHIDVIRMGLLDMEPEAILAGPYHPAFGELVLSRICYENVAKKLEGLRGLKITLRVNPRFVSILTGQKKQNINRFIQEFHLQDIKIEQDASVAGDAILVLPQKN